jgi:hypothetical protein
MMKKDNGVCNYCGCPFDEHPRCPGCGYTWCDVRIHGDHSICGKPEPMPPREIRDKENKVPSHHTTGANCGSVFCSRHGIQESICLKCHEEIINVPYDGKDMIG